MSTSVRVANFLPSTNGFAFPNHWPHQPVVTIPFPTGSIKIGDAAGGLCGGMAFAVRDYFEDGRPIPPDTDNPAANTPLYDYIVQRLLDSFDVPEGVARFYEWQLPPHDEQTGMRTQEWPAIRKALDAGHLVCLGLIRAQSFSPGDLGKNHQVLTYGYDLDDDGRVTLRLCDCNHPGDDDITYSFPTKGHWDPVYLVDGQPGAKTYAAFVQDYTHSSPPGAQDETPSVPSPQSTMHAI